MIDFEEPGKEMTRISISDAIQEILSAEKVSGWGKDIKDSWIKLGFEGFLSNFKGALPKNYP